jgi:hypothetical protein
VIVIGMLDVATKAANRRLFDNGTGKPIDLGPTCNVPTGTQPCLCLTAAGSSWNVDKGSCAGFTSVGGALTVAPTSPSD